MWYIAATTARCARILVRQQKCNLIKHQTSHFEDGFIGSRDDIEFRNMESYIICLKQSHNKQSKTNHWPLQQTVSSSSADILKISLQMQKIWNFIK